MLSRRSFVRGKQPIILNPSYDGTPAREEMRMSDRLNSCWLVALFASLALAGDAQAQSGLRALSEAEILQRFTNVRLGPDGQEGTRYFRSAGVFEQLARLPLHGRYWASGSRLCTQIPADAQAPSCVDVRIDAKGLLYMGEANGRVREIILEPSAP